MLDSSKLNLSKSIGLLFAIVHFFLFILFIGYMHILVEDGQAQLLWIIFLVVDFPVSLVTLLAYKLLPHGTEIANIARFITPYIVHGIIGSMWWYFLPQIISYFFKKISK